MYISITVTVTKTYTNKNKELFYSHFEQIFAVLLRSSNTLKMRILETYFKDKLTI